MDQSYTLLLISVTLLLVSCATTSANSSPRSRLNFDTDLARSLQQRFGGNETHTDYFKVLLIDGDSVLVGARNVVYEIDLHTLKETKRITWHSSEEDIQICRLKQKSAEQCQNYIRVIARKTPSHLFVCGTNAFKPLCRTYHNDGYDYQLRSEQKGIAMCPPDPFHNSTAVYAGDQLFSASVVDINGRDALIYSKPLRTEQHDSQWLNDPNFVSSFDYGDKVYMFFREAATEHINCGKTIFSRVARVCKNDKGGARVLMNTWTSFFKARLNCSIPGEYPFYFNEIQGTSEIGKGNYMPPLIASNSTDMIYAIFNTPKNSISGSAICAFRFSDILTTFEGQFKEQKSARSNWLPVSQLDTPEPHPAKACANNSRLIPDQSLNFIKKHPLMNAAVPAFGGQPVFIETGPRYRLTQMAVDWQVKGADDRYYDVLFIGTDDGRIIKAINKARGSAVETIVIEDLRVFPDGHAVTSVTVHQSAAGSGVRKLVVASNSEIKTIALHRCELWDSSCRACVAMQDPYCSWLNSRCVASNRGVQNIEWGKHQRCGAISETHDEESIEDEDDSIPAASDLSEEYVSEEEKQQHVPKAKQSSSEWHNKKTVHSAGRFGVMEIAVATVASITLSLALGFVIGYKSGQHRQRHHPFGGRLTRMAPPSPSVKGTNQLMGSEHAYTTPPRRLPPLPPPPPPLQKQLNARLDNNSIVHNCLNDDLVKPDNYDTIKGHV